jgi:hypothetical protein
MPKEPNRNEVLDDSSRLLLDSTQNCDCFGAHFCFHFHRGSRQSRVASPSADAEPESEHSYFLTVLYLKDQRYRTTVVCRLSCCVCRKVRVLPLDYSLQGHTCYRGSTISYSNQHCNGSTNNVWQRRTETNGNVCRVLH